MNREVKVAERKFSETQQSLIIDIIWDSQTAINKLKVLDSRVCQALRAQIYEKVEQLVRHYHISVRWIPSHSGIEGSERVDTAAKEAGRAERTGTAK